MYTVEEIHCLLDIEIHIQQLLNANTAHNVLIDCQGSMMSGWTRNNGFRGFCPMNMDLRSITIKHSGFAVDLHLHGFSMAL